MEPLKSFFPKVYGSLRVAAERVLKGMIFSNRNGQR